MALSGGVDSSVAAAVLLEQGHEVVGITMKLWGGESDSGCCSVSDVDDARRVAQQLDIDHYVFNFSEEFDRYVVDPYVQAHRDNRTPNPCVECNRHLKFDVLLRRCDELGFDAVATGHHARVCRVDGASFVARGADAAKDQSYVLYPLTSSALERVMFPIGHLHKSEVREQATRLGLRTARKPDSQDVCFITHTHGRETFLGDRIALRPGRVVDLEGNEIGTTEAVELVTIGQRRGLNAAGGTEPRYVVDIDPASATVTMGPREALMVDATVLKNMVWARGTRDGEVFAQTSAHGSPARARCMVADDGVELRWDEARVRVAPGQSVVLYVNDCVLGGGIAS